MHNYVSDLTAAGLLKSVRSVDTPAARGALRLITSLCCRAVAIRHGTAARSELHRGQTGRSHVSSQLPFILLLCFPVSCKPSSSVTVERRRTANVAVALVSTAAMLPFLSAFILFLALSTTSWGRSRCIILSRYLQNSATHGQKYPDWINNATGEICVFEFRVNCPFSDPVLHSFKIFRLDVSCVLCLLTSCCWASFSHWFYWLVQIIGNTKVQMQVFLSQHTRQQTATTLSVVEEIKS